jgi:hypothetical protein
MAGTLFGEDWITASNRGAVGFIAHTSYGLASLLKYYTDTFYKIGYGDSIFIQRGLGDIQKEVAKDFIQTIGNSATNVTQVQQMVLLGDPAVRLFGAAKADYEINENNIFIESFNGAEITALTDSFKLNIIVRNFGQAKDKSLLIRVAQTFNDNTTKTYHELFPPVMYSDTVSFTIYKDNAGGFGNNVFNVKLDSDDIIAELSETNNTASKSLLIPLNGTKNLFPNDFAILNSNQVNLLFQTTDLLSGEREFLVELDTVDSFNSSYKKEFAISSTVLASQPVSILTQDTLAYYWRTKLKDPLPGESTTWTLSSFTYINNGEEGWAQVHFPQYLKNESEGLVKDAAALQLKFEETETSISIKTFGASNPAPNTAVSVKVNDAEYNLFTQGGGAGGCRTNTINLMAFNKTSTVPYPAIPFTFSDNRTCGREPQVINNFSVTEVEIAGSGIVQWVDNVITGDSVVLFSMGNAGYSSWSVTVKNKLGELGISLAQVNALVNGEPVVIYGKKGSVPGSAKIFKAIGTPANTKELLVDQTITGRYTSGKMNSVVIGPANSWRSFVRRTGSMEASDVFNFDIIGIKLNGNEEVLQTGITTDFDLSAIDAQVFPFLKIVYGAEDDIGLTPVQLRQWLVLYEPMAEGILLFKSSREAQALQEGESWTGNYGFLNISNKNFTDSLTVNQELFNVAERTSTKNAFKIFAPAPGDTSNFEITIHTQGRSGLNDVNVFVNPYLLPEVYYDNNFVQLPDHLNILRDVYKPVLDVTVDGRYLINGDYVSSNPHIVVALWDENKITFKTDTLGVNIFLKYPCNDDDCDFQRVNFSQQNVKWMPATSDTNLIIEFDPQDLPAGEYTLHVEATDAHGNTTGESPYEVTFKVTEESSVTMEEPYPNPSSGNFFFTMVIGGGELPKDFNMQIISVGGKIINEVSMGSDLFHIGVNDLTWEGTDSAGNALQNGIYIYRMHFKVSGHDISKNGKLVLIR